MEMHQFCDHMDEVLALSKLDKNSRAFHCGLKKLMKDMGIDREFLPVPGKKRWLTVEIFGLLMGVSSFIGLAILYFFGDGLSESQTFAWVMGIFIYMYASIVVTLYANIRQSRLTRQYLTQRIFALAERAQKIPPDALERACTLFFHTPEILWEDELPAPVSISCGCWKCVSLFDTSFTGESGSFDPVCPECGLEDAHVVYGDETVPATRESLQILHELFDEEL